MLLIKGFVFEQEDFWNQSLLLNAAGRQRGADQSRVIFPALFVPLDNWVASFCEKKKSASNHKSGCVVFSLRWLPQASLKKCLRYNSPFLSTFVFEKHVGSCKWHKTTLHSAQGSTKKKRSKWFVLEFAVQVILERWHEILCFAKQSCLIILIWRFFKSQFDSNQHETETPERHFSQFGKKEKVTFSYWIMVGGTLHAILQ